MGRRDRHGGSGRLPGEVDDRVALSLSATGRECVGAARCSFRGGAFRRTCAGAGSPGEHHRDQPRPSGAGRHGRQPRRARPRCADHRRVVPPPATTAATDELSVRSAEGCPLGPVVPLPEDVAERLDEAVSGLDSALAGYEGAAAPHAVRTDRNRWRSCATRVHLAASSLSRDDDSAVRHRAASGLEEIHDVAGRLISGAGSDADVVEYLPGPALHVAPLSVARQVGNTCPVGTARCSPAPP